MNCPNCNSVMDPWEDDGLVFTCTNFECGETVTLCKICKLPNKDLNSDICGHPSCIEKKMRFMWRPEVEKKTRRERTKHV